MTRRILPVLTLALLTFAVLAYPTHADAPNQLGDDALCVQLSPDGTWRVIPCPTDTPAPTTTPEATATDEPTPTVTPSRTPTATPTATPPIEASPTPEDLRTPSSTPPPTWTPSPTLTSTPFPPTEVTCWGTVTVDSLNVRVEPWGAVVGGVKRNQQLSFDAKWFQDFWWWRIEFWDATADKFTGAWVSSTYIAEGDIADCTGLKDLTPQAKFETKQGPHILNADGAKKLLPFCGDMTTAKFFEHAMGYVSAYRACNPDLWIVCRFWSDDLARQSDFDAVVAWEMVGKKYPADCNAVEPENEKLPRDPAEWALWSNWAKEFCGMLASRNMQCLMLGMGPGWPAFTDLQYITEFVLWADTHPLPDGRYHGISSHASPFAPYTRPDQPWLNEQYITYRYVLMRDWWLVTEGFDLFDLNIAWALTEVGLSDGYSGSWSAPYTCAEVGLSFWDTQKRHSEIGFIVAFHWWSFGADPFWTDDSACAATVWE